MFFNEAQMLIVGLVLWLLYLGIIFLRYIYESKKLNNADEEILEEAMR